MTTPLHRPIKAWCVRCGGGITSHKNPDGICVDCRPHCACGRLLGSRNKTGICALCARKACKDCGQVVAYDSVADVCRECRIARQQSEAARRRARRHAPGSLIALPENPETAPLEELCRPLSGHCMPTSSGMFRLYDDEEAPA